MLSWMAEHRVEECRGCAGAGSPSPMTPAQCLVVRDTHRRLRLRIADRRCLGLPNLQLLHPIFVDIYSSIIVYRNDVTFLVVWHNCCSRLANLPCPFSARGASNTCSAFKTSFPAAESSAGVGLSPADLRPQPRAKSRVAGVSE